MFTSRKELGEYGCRLLVKTDRLHRKAFDNIVKRFDIHRSQHIMLMRIGENRGISQTELARLLEISTPAVAVALRKLDTDGYIKRKAALADGRFNEIEITEKGERAVELSRRFFGEIDRAMLDGISDSQLSCFVECLERMHENLLKLQGDEAL